MQEKELYRSKFNPYTIKHYYVCQRNKVRSVKNRLSDFYKFFTSCLILC
jgi:hypothetical protein